MHCLSARLQDMDLINRLRNDYTVHRDEEIYARYMHQLTTANIRTKGNTSMIICEGLLNLYGTSSEEIIERTRQEAADYYLPKIDVLSTQIDYLKSLLRQNNIPFDPDFKADSEQ